MSLSYRVRLVAVLFLLVSLLCFSTAGRAQTVEPIADFSTSSSARPDQILTDNPFNHYLYGISYDGTLNGIESGGSVFEISPTNTITTLYSWPGPPPNGPTGDVLASPYFSSDSALYGIFGGNIFSLTTAGTYTQFSTAGYTLTGPLLYGNDGKYFFCNGTKTVSGTMIPVLFEITPNRSHLIAPVLTPITLTGTLPSLELSDINTKDVFYGNVGSSIYEVTINAATLSGMSSFIANAGNAVGLIAVNAAGTYLYTGGSTLNKINISTSIVTPLYEFSQTGIGDGTTAATIVVVTMIGSTKDYVYGVSAGGSSPGYGFEASATGTLGIFGNLPSDPKPGTTLALDYDNGVYNAYGGTFQGGTSGVGIMYELGSLGDDTLPDPISLSLVPSTVVGGSSPPVSGTLTMSASAPASKNVYVSLNTANLSLINVGAQYPPNYRVQIGTGSPSVGFTLYTQPVIRKTVVPISAGANTATATLTLLPAAPTITSFSPASGPVGKSVTITGTNLTSTSLVKFNGTSATFTVNSDSQVTATVPNSATTGVISLTTDGGSATSSTNFMVSPTITSFTPTHGPVGQSVTLSGSALAGGTVTINSVAQNITGTTYGMISFKVVAGTAPGGIITVTTSAGSATSSVPFSVP